MLISAKVVRRPRKVYRCSRCPAPIDGPHLRLCGMPDDQEDPKPMVMRLHGRCVPQKRIDTEPKIVAALAKLGDMENGNA